LNEKINLIISKVELRTLDGLKEFIITVLMTDLMNKSSVRDSFEMIIL